MLSNNCMHYNYNHLQGNHANCGSAISKSCMPFCSLRLAMRKWNSIRANSFSSFYNLRYKMMSTVPLKAVSFQSSSNALIQPVEKISASSVLFTDNHFHRKLTIFFLICISNFKIKRRNWPKRSITFSSLVSISRMVHVISRSRSCSWRGSLVSFHVRISHQIGILNTVWNL